MGLQEADYMSRTFRSVFIELKRADFWSCEGYNWRVIAIRYFSSRGLTPPRAPITMGMTVAFLSSQIRVTSLLSSWYFSIFSSSLSETNRSFGTATSMSSASLFCLSSRTRLGLHASMGLSFPYYNVFNPLEASSSLLPAHIYT